jgi:hypothetical protein
MSFHLTKWYGDCTTADGRCWIAYWADLRWRALHLRYAALLHAAPGLTPNTKTSLHPGPAPAHTGDDFTWSEPSLAFHCRWIPSAPAHSELLFTTEQGCVRWQCLAPAADATVLAGSAQPVKGLGYLERLDITVPPWSLPIETLLWGRYLSDDDALVWLDWHGPQPRRLVLRRGAPVEAAHIDEAHLRLADGTTLLCNRDLTLREGALGPNVLSAIPKLHRLLPLTLLRLHEHKWLSRASLEKEGRALSHGWAIHEVVRWP